MEKKCSKSFSGTRNSSDIKETSRYGTSQAIPKKPFVLEELKKKTDLLIALQ